MNRRSFLRSVGLTGAGLSLAASPLGAWAQYNTSPGLKASPTDIVVLELANFYCSRCNAVNAQYARMKDAARSRGFDFRFAPLVWERQSIWPDRVYYAFRDLYPDAESLVRDAIFDGIHREGLRFEDMPQVMAHLERRQIPKKALETHPDFDLALVADRANSDAVLLSELKANRLIEQSAADEVPVFMWIAGGDVLHTITPSEVNGDPRSLVQLVINTLYSAGSKTAE